MKNIHLLPTDKPSRLYFYKGNNEYPPQYSLRSLKSLPFNDSIANQNIYITSDEEIKEENLTKEIYVIDTQTNNLGKLTCKNKFFKGSSKLIEVEWKNKQNLWNYCNIREIILTTDLELQKDGVQAIDDEFLEWFVKNPSCEEVDVNKSYGGTYYITYPYKIIIPKEESNYNMKQEILAEMEKQETLEEDCPCTDECLGYLTKTCKGIEEEPKQETLEEAKYRVYKDYWNENHNLEVKSNFLTAFKLGAKWQQEQDKKLYSEEDMIEASKYGYNFHKTTQFPNQEFEDSCIRNTQQWFEQFKKK